MTTATPLYGTAAALTHTLASLASDTNLLVGRESTAINNITTDDAIDAIVGGFITAGSATPTVNRQIEVWSYGSYDGTTYSPGATGSDAGLTLTAGNKTQLKLLTVIPTTSTTAQRYYFGPYSVAQAFGGVMPTKWGIWVVHNTGTNLHGTAGNHEVRYVPVKYESS